jgi:hypothetical protein
MLLAMLNPILQATRVGLSYGGRGHGLLGGDQQAAGS